MLQAGRRRIYDLLRWSERFTNLDMVYFASGSFWQTFGQVLNAILALSLIILFANLLPKETYGTYRYLISLAGLLNVFTLTGMNQAVAQAVSVGKEGAFRTAARYQLKWNSILIIAFFTLGVYYLVNENFAYTGAFIILGLATPFTNALNTYGAYLSGKREFRLNNFFSIISTLIYVGGMVAAITLSGEVIWLVTAYALATTGANLLFYYLTVRKFNPPLSPAHDTLRYGRHLTLIGLFAPVAAQIDSVILNHFWGAAPLAVYAIATAIPNRAVPLIKDWVDVGFPKAAKKTPEELDRTFFKRILQGLAAGSVLTAAYWVVAPVFFQYFLPQYHDAVIYTQILAITFIFAMPNRYISVLMSSQKMTKRILVNSAVQAVMVIGLYLALGIWGGILGLILAQVAEDAISLLVNIAIWRYKRRRTSKVPSAPAT